MSLPEHLWNSPVIKKRLFNEAGFESNNGAPHKVHYWVIAPEGNTKRGEVILKNFIPNFADIEPHEMQQEFARQVQKMLQSGAHHDGLWLVGWTHPPATGDVVRIDGSNCWDRLIMLWLDEDGDPKYTLESDIPFAEMMENGEAYYLGLAEQAHASWEEAYGKKAMKDDFAVTEDQQTKAALAALH